MPRRIIKLSNPPKSWLLWSSFIIYNVWGSLKTQNGHGHPPRFQNGRIIGRKLFGARGCLHKIRFMCCKHPATSTTSNPPKQGYTWLSKFLSNKIERPRRRTPRRYYERSPFVDSILGHFMHLMDVFVCFGAIYCICCMLWKNGVKFL